MVPKSRQTESVSTEYLRQARIVWRELISIAKKLPKSRAFTETQYICRAGYDLMQAAAEADGIYVMTVEESAQRLVLLNDAYGRLCLIGMFIDAWLDDMPQVIYTEQDAGGAEMGVSKPFVKISRLESLAGTVSTAMKVTKGAIKAERMRLKSFDSKSDASPVSPEQAVLYLRFIFVNPRWWASVLASSSNNHWTRSVNPSNSTNFRYVNNSGDWNNNNATNTNYVFPDFLHLV